MKKLIAAVCFMFALSPLAYAADKATADDKKAAPAAEKKEPTAKQKAQQERMKNCNDKATDKKGDERKKYMSSCLKGEDPSKAEQSPKKTAQQEKMAVCNKEAGEKSMKGDDRKKFMKECLSK